MSGESPPTPVGNIDWVLDLLPRSRRGRAISGSHWKDRIAVVFATFGGAGLAPVAPGTVGSLAGVGLFLVLRPAGWAAVLAGLALVSATGVWAAARAEHLYAVVDDGRVVIDEVSGQLIALVPLLTPGFADVSQTAFLAWVVTAFVAFRVFDIAKPGPVGWAERRFHRVHGGLGVMADDWVAGVLAAGLLVVLRLASDAAFAHASWFPAVGGGGLA